MSEQRFQRLYFDSSILIAAKWPRLDASLLSLLSAARHLNISIHIPEVALLELEQYWTVQFLKNRDRLLSSFSSVRGMLADSAALTVAVPDIENARADYAQQVEAIMTDWALSVTPMPSRTVRQLLEDSVAARFPFKGTDQGFQDALIFFSVVEDATTVSARSAFVVRDSVYETPAAKDIAASHSIELYESVKATYDHVGPWFDEAIQREQTDLRRKALARLSRMLPELTDFVMNGLDLSEVQIPNPERLLGPPQIKGVDLKSVVLPYPADLKSGRQKKIGVLMQVRVEAPAWHNVYNSDLLIAQGHAAIERRESQVTVEIDAEIEADTHYEAEDFNNIAPLSVKFSQGTTYMPGDSHMSSGSSSFISYSPGITLPVRR